MAEASRPTGIDGYGSGRKARVWEIAEAIWAAVSGLGLTYVYPPASFEEEGQKVRSPGDLLEHRVGTCLDTSLLLASCFEQAGLRSALILVQGHAFVGLALQPFDNDGPVLWDVQALRKRRDVQELILIESTLLTEKESVRFAEAVPIGGTHLEDWAPAPFHLAVDVAAARRSGIRPLELGDRHALEGEASSDPPSETPCPELAFDRIPTFLEDGPAPEGPVLTGADRLESWKRRLLDLTLRNTSARAPSKARPPFSGQPVYALAGAVHFGGRFPAVRPLEDIPDMELVGLATALLGRGLTDAECIAAAAEELGIARLSRGTEAKLMTIVLAARDRRTAASEDREAA